MELLLAESTLDATTLVTIAGLVVGGCVVTYVLSQRALKRTIAELRHELEQQASSMAAKIPPAPVPMPVQSAPPVPAPVAKPVPPPPAREEVTPETLLILAAAVTAFLGKKVRIRSARMLYAHESFNSWSQQGRVVVQASHNLAQRGY